ncbi:Thioredoxin-interacting protein [Haliaeetus albicilla]|uniref:Thioredoxin-interacting protein n=1 Tax=Haliaeetus albicilla TaxID=8969 RepID=A0A091PP36_HALAL|nr:Thioredoxin-interacting protein [Haliaeetus albicilla]
MVMFKKVKAFVMAFSEPEKVYCSGEKEAGGILGGSSSMASQASSEMSWVDLNLPDAPEGEENAVDCEGVLGGHHCDSPAPPLNFDSPIFMYAPEFKFMPPPTYTEVDPCIANNNVQ